MKKFKSVIQMMDERNINRRMGLIKMSDIVYKNNWYEIYVLFRQFRPTHIEFRHWENNVWYFFGESELFDLVKEGEVVPQYEVTFKRDDNNVLNFEFKKL